MRWNNFKEEMKDFFRDMKGLWPVFSMLGAFFIILGGFAIWNNHRISQLPTITLIKEQWECSKKRTEMQVVSVNGIIFHDVCIEYRRK